LAGDKGLEDLQVDIMIMSGVDDGLLLTFSTANEDGVLNENEWMLTLGRRDDNDVCLRNDTYTSRYHARLHLRDGHCWLEDCDSKNGTFIEEDAEDARISGTIELHPGQLFRVGRTWMRVQTEG
jgi:pSer/pThr/pTyr-binding forkhead associated (FHA) protein